MVLKNDEVCFDSFICTFSWREIWVLDYFSYVKYEDLCATINPSTIKDFEDRKYWLSFCMLSSCRSFSIYLSLSFYLSFFLFSFFSPKIKSFARMFLLAWPSWIRWNRFLVYREKKLRKFFRLIRKQHQMENKKK